MLIYEKNNKLNLNFDPSKSIEDNQLLKCLFI